MSFPKHDIKCNKWGRPLCAEGKDNNGNFIVQSDSLELSSNDVTNRSIHAIISVNSQNHNISLDPKEDLKLNWMCKTMTQNIYFNVSL